ncbi:MAG: ParA family protein [Actinomycetota bacterium]
MDGHQPLERGVVVCSGKGGVGKSSVAAGLAGTAAAMGWRTLAVDLDPQGNLGQDLGYLQNGQSDHGEALASAYELDAIVEPLRGVRDGLDVVPGGGYTDRLVEILRHRVEQVGVEALLQFRRLLVGLGQGYDLVVVDTPPSTRDLLDAALASVRFVMVPVRFDRGSIDGVERVSDRYRAVRDAGLNPDLELLGIALFGFATTERRMLADTRAELEAELDGVAPVFDRYIREAKKAARHMREHGVIASEYLLAAREALPWYEAEAGAETFARNAAGLAEDYWELTREILQRLTDRVAPTVDLRERETVA